MSKALIVVDMQNDFVTGSLANPAAQAIVPNIVELIKSGEFDHVVYTLDSHYPNYLETAEGKKLPVKHCICGEKGWSPVQELAELIKEEGFSLLMKPTFGSLQLCSHLSTMGHFDEVTFCGTCTDICVVSNALILKAACPNLTINVKADCCAGLTPEKHKAALEVMESCQINII